jgi:hypothetical protein
MITIVSTKDTCIKCLREFNLLDEIETSEFFYGHDCKGK